MEKRLAKRYLKQVPTRFGDEADWSHVGVTSDISETGVLLRSSRIYPPSTMLSIKFVLPGGETAYCQGLVQWAKRVPPSLARIVQKHGMGISLSSASLEYRQFVKELTSLRAGESVSPKRLPQSA
jgi:hypothetical protein